MVRNVMMILGLSLAIASFGCSDDENGGDGGSGGTAGSGGSGGAPVTDACLNATDTAAVCDDGFSDVVSTCASDASGAGAATSTCLQQDPPDGAGLSADCADCQGDQVECIRDNCVLGASTVCFPPIADQEACDTCAADAGCTSGYDTCAGAVDCGGAGGAGGASGAGGAGGAGGAV